MKITKEDAKQIYEYAPPDLKERMEREFGPDVFQKIDYEDFKNFDDLCRACGTTEYDFNIKWCQTDYDPSTIAFERLKILTGAYNQDWKFNLYDTDQKKWFPWYKVSSSGVGVAHSAYDCDCALASVGSRLCFESEEKSNHAGTTFAKLFEDFISAKY